MASRGFRGASARIDFSIGGGAAVLAFVRLVDKAFNDLSRNAERYITLQNRMAQMTNRRDFLEDQMKWAQAAGKVRLVDSLTQQIDKLNTALGLTQTKIDAIGKGSIGRWQAMFNIIKNNQPLLQSMAKGFALAGAALAAIKVAKFLSDSTDLAIKIDRTRASIEALTGSAETANKILNDLFALSLTQPVDATQLIEGAKTLLSVGAPVDVLTRDLKSLSVIAAAVNQPMEELAVIYGEIMNKNRLYREDVLQFSRRGIPLMQELERILQVDRDQLNKLVSDGRIKFELFQYALRSMTEEGGRYATVNQQLMQTTSGSWQIAMNALTIIMKDLGEAIDKAFVKDTVQAFAGSLVFVAQGLEGIRDISSQIYSNPFWKAIIDGDIPRLLYGESLVEDQKLGGGKGMFDNLGLNPQMRQAAEAFYKAGQAATEKMLRDKTLAAEMDEKAFKNLSEMAYEYDVLTGVLTEAEAKALKFRASLEGGSEEVKDQATEAFRRNQALEAQKKDEKEIADIRLKSKEAQIDAQVSSGEITKEEGERRKKLEELDKKIKELNKDGLDHTAVIQAMTDEYDEFVKQSKLDEQTRQWQEFAEAVRESTDAQTKLALEARKTAGEFDKSIPFIDRMEELAAQVETGLLTEDQAAKSIANQFFKGKDFSSQTFDTKSLTNSIQSALLSHKGEPTKEAVDLARTVLVDTLNGNTEKLHLDMVAVTTKLDKLNAVVD